MNPSQMIAVIRAKGREWFYECLGPKRVCSLVYRRTLHKSINWDHPRDLNEKINWLKIYGDTSRWSDLADKYKVREYVTAKGLADILIPLYAKFDRVEDIDFDRLPNSFVLKNNNGTGDCIIVKDKSKINPEEIRQRLQQDLYSKFALFSGEPHYLKIKPCIVAEQLIDNDELGFTSSLVDYKIWCFNGRPTAIWACYNRTKKDTYVNVYDLNWRCHPEYAIATDHYKDGRNQIPRPKNLELMLQIATKLAEGLPEARIDLYESKGKVYFGEITLTGNRGAMDFFTPKYLLEMGDQITLPPKDKHAS
jgi:hypothetical protein